MLTNRNSTDRINVGHIANPSIFSQGELIGLRDSLFIAGREAHQSRKSLPASATATNLAHTASHDPNAIVYIVHNETILAIVQQKTYKPYSNGNIWPSLTTV
jgi:hypothetical protein